MMDGWRERERENEREENKTTDLKREREREREADRQREGETERTCGGSWCGVRRSAFCMGVACTRLSYSDGKLL